MTSLTDLLTRFVKAFSGGYANLVPSIDALLGTIIAIEVCLLGIWWALSGREQIVPAMKKLLFIGFWVWFVQNFPSLADAFMQSLVAAGFKAAGSSGGMSLLMDPSHIADMALQATFPLANAIEKANAFNIGTTFVLGLSFIILLVAYFVLAIQVFLTVLEYYLLMAVAGILLPWGALPQTKFLAEKAIGAVIASAIKLMVIALIIGVTEPVLRQMSFAQANNFTGLVRSSWDAILGVGAITFLAWHVPGLAAGLMSGSPSLSAGVALQSTAAGALMGGGLVAAGATAAVKAASGAVGAASRLAGVASTGAKMGATFGGGVASMSSRGAGGQATPASAGVRAISAVGGGARAVGAAVLRGTVGRAAAAVKGHVSSNYAAGAATGWEASKNPLGGASGGGAASSRGRDGAPAWAARAAQSLRRVPPEARPSGGVGVRI